MPGLLASHVHVRNEGGANHVFAPGDEVPAWAARKITNPGAWAQPPQPHELQDPEPGARDDDPLAETGPGPSSGSPPAQSATKDVWAAYAAVRGVAVADGATKADLIAAVGAAEQQ